MRFLMPSLMLFGLLCGPADAAAHLGLDAPASRYGPDTLKTGPCGVANGERTDNVTYFEPGETIEVRWNEYVEHPGHYRIAFDADGDDDFVDPATIDEFYSNEAVLLDNIADEDSGNRDYSATVTLPDLTCDNCTLQVIQVMYDKPPYTTPGNDIYYQCADLVLRVGGAPDGGVGTGGNGGGTGGSGGGTGGTGVGTGGNDGLGGSGVDPGGSSGCSASTRGGGAWMAWLLLLLVARRLARASRLPV